MEAVAQKKSVWNLILFFIYIHLARCQVTLKHNSASALANTFICGTNTKFTCMIDPAPGLMSWVKDSTTQTHCEGANDSCVYAIVDNYQFTSNVAVKEFYLTVNLVKFSNAGTFTCSNGASVDDSKTISIAAVPNAITMTQESGTGTITLQATTDCAFPMSNVSIKWYYLKELTDTPQLYTDNGFSPVRTEDSSTCTSGNCTSGVGVSKVVSTVEFDEKGIGGTSAYLQAKMVHKAAPSSDPAVVATTTNKFIIIEEVYVCFWRESFDSCLECWIYFFLLIVPSLVVAAVLIGIFVEACFEIWVCMSLVRQIVSFCMLLFGLGLYLCDYIRKWLKAKFCNCFYYWKPKCCCICVWIWNCIYHRKFKCCCKCVWNVCDCCKNCYVKGLPCLDLILLVSVIGIPVDLGILLVWIVDRKWYKNAIRYVLITDDGTSINEDGTWTLGASVGAYCVTKVTPGGPADGKLKVGDQMNKINGITVTGENPNQILAMQNDTENLTLDVSQVGSVCTSESTFELKREQLGFEFEYIAMVTNVTEESKAEGKMEKGDLILSINGKSTAGKSNAEVNKELKKPEVMELSIKRAGEDNKTIRLDLKGKASLGIAIEKVGENIEVSNIEPQSAAAAAAKISGEIKVGDCILCVNGVSTAGLQVVEIEEMLTFSIILKVTKDVTLKELDPDKDGSFGFETFPPSTSTSVALNKQTTVTSVTSDRPANVVKSVTPNGPAARHGIKAGDKIVSINNEETKGKSHQEIKAMLETFGTSISLKIEENDKPNQTNGHGGNDIEMGHVNPRAQDSGRVQTLETTEEKQDFMKPLLDDKC